MARSFTMASTLTTFDFALKELYSDQRVEDLTYQDRPFLAWLDKDEDFEGDVMPEPLIYGNPQGVGGVFSTAQGNATQTSGVKFNITVGDYFGVVDIGDKVLKASRGNPGSFLRNKATEIDGLINQFANSMAIYLYGNGGQALGRRSSIATDTVTLTNPEDAVNFEVGMTVVASTADGTSGTLRSGSTTVASIDRDAGTVTLASAAAITSFSDNDYIFRQGDFGQTAGVDIVKGLDAWIPASAPSATAFFGVDRSVDTVRLGGVRLSSSDVSGLNIEERLQKLCTRVQRTGGGPGATDIFLNPEKWQNLAIALQSKGIRPLEKQVNEKVKFGYAAIQLATSGGMVDVWSDRFCPIGTAFALNKRSWKLRSMMKVPHFISGDGLKMLRKSSSNDYEVRIVAYPQLCTNAPGWNGRCPV